jgi:hypothetical protein
VSVKGEVKQIIKIKRMRRGEGEVKQIIKKKKGGRGRGREKNMQLKKNEIEEEKNDKKKRSNEPSYSTSLSKIRKKPKLTTHMLPTQQKGKNNKSIIKWYRVKLKKPKLTQLTCGLRYKA